MKADHHGAVRELPHAFRVHPRHMKAIPSTAERIPAIGLGVASSFSRAARTPEECYARLRSLLHFKVDTKRLPHRAQPTAGLAKEAARAQHRGHPEAFPRCNLSRSQTP